MGLPDPHPLVTSKDPSPDLSASSENSKKNLDFFCDFFMTFASVPDPADPDPDLYDPYVLGHPGSASGSVSQRYGSEDPDTHPYQNVTDPQH